jgi:hypothetical protein
MNDDSSPPKEKEDERVTRYRRVNKQAQEICRKLAVTLVEQLDGDGLLPADFVYLVHSVTANLNVAMLSSFVAVGDLDEGYMKEEAAQHLAGLYEIALERAKATREDLKQKEKNDGEQPVP